MAWTVLIKVDCFLDTQLNLVLPFYDSISSIIGIEK